MSTCRARTAVLAGKVMMVGMSLQAKVAGIEKWEY